MISDREEEVILVIDINGKAVVISDRMQELIKSKQAKVVVYEDSEGEIYVEMNNTQKTDDVIDTSLLCTYHTESKAIKFANELSKHFNIPLENKL